MRVSLADKGNRNFDLYWPPDQPSDEQVRFLCRRLDHKTRRQIKDKLFGASADSTAVDPNNLEFNMRLGTIQELKLQETIVDWDGLEDENGKPIKFNFNKLTLMLEHNFDVDASEHGSCEEWLLQEIDARNGLEEINPGNLNKPAKPTMEASPQETPQA